MPTYSEIQKFVQHHHGFVPKTEWIEHVKLVWAYRRAARPTAPVGVVA
jgi:hypothetical protein